MTERDDHIFDKIIRDKLSQYAEAVPDDIWENISKKRIFTSFFRNHYKLITVILLLVILTLTVTISMTYKTNREKDQHNLITSKNLESRILVKDPVITGKVVKTNQYTKSNTFKSGERNKIAEKPAVQTTSIIHAAKIEKPSDNPTIKGQNEVKATSGRHQKIDKNKTTISTNNKSKITNTTPIINTPDHPPLIEPLVQAIPAQPEREVANLTKTVYLPADSQSSNKMSPEIITDNSSVKKPIVPSHTPAIDSNTIMQPENITTPTIPFKPHLRCLDFIFSPGLVTKSTKASDPASGSYARMLDRVTKTRYSVGFEIRYRYYFNQFWNVATGLMYNQVKEQLIGQTKAEQINIKRTTATIISPFDPPRRITLIDTLRTAAVTISQDNTFSYLRIPVLLGANFRILKIPLNLYAGFGYFYSIKQQGAYINSTTFESTNFQTNLDNPYKNAQGVNIQAGINANIRMTKRSYFLIGADYSRYVIAINDKTYQYQQYYSIWNLNLGITYQLF